MDDLSLYAALLRKMKARKRKKPVKSNDEAMGKSVVIATIGKWKTDRTGRKGFYHVKNVRGNAVLVWRPWAKKKKSRRLI